MIFRAIFISFKSQELVFQLNDDEVDDPMRKKLMKLGLPDIQFDWPENDSDSFQELPGGFYRQGDFACSGISIAELTNESRYSAILNPNTNKISVMLDGLFFCINAVDDDISATLKQF